MVKTLAAIFGILCLAGVFFMARASGAEGGIAEVAFGGGLIVFAMIGWTTQLLVEGIDRALRALKRKFG